MRHPARRSTRRGAVVFEAAFAYPAAFFIILITVIGGFGIFRYQEVAYLAREGARYGSTHGARFRSDAAEGVGTPGTADGSSTVTTTLSDGSTQTYTILWYKTDPTATSGSDTSWTGDIYDNSIRPNLVALDKKSMTVRCGWPTVINQTDKPDNWPGSKVMVSVSYQWFPEMIVVGPINLTATSSMPVTN
jgi:hypothetical protein